MTRPRVYLAGPITGESYDDAVGWRKAAAEALAPEIDALSPLRFKSYLKKQTELADVYEGMLLSGERMITLRDRNDVMTSNGVIINLLPAQRSRRVSIGSCIEIGWADAWRKPTIVVMDKKLNPHDHAMIRAMTEIVEDLEDAVMIMRALLIPGV